MTKSKNQRTQIKTGVFPSNEHFTSQEWPVLSSDFESSKLTGFHLHDGNFPVSRWLLTSKISAIFSNQVMPRECWKFLVYGKRRLFKANEIKEWYTETRHILAIWKFKGLNLLRGRSLKGNCALKPNKMLRWHESYFFSTLCELMFCNVIKIRF